MRTTLGSVGLALAVLVGLTGLAPSVGAVVSTTIADGTVQRTDGGCSGSVDVTLHYTRAPSRVDFTHDGPCQFRYASDSGPLLGPGPCQDVNGTLDCHFGTSGGLNRTYDIQVGPQGSFEARVLEDGELVLELEGDVQRVDV